MRTRVTALLALGFLFSGCAISEEKKKEELTSGLQKGDSVPAFYPIQVAGPDQGKPTCPV